MARWTRSCQRAHQRIGAKSENTFGRSSQWAGYWQPYYHIARWLQYHNFNDALTEYDGCNFDPDAQNAAFITPDANYIPARGRWLLHKAPDFLPNQVVFSGSHIPSKRARPEVFEAFHILFWGSDTCIFQIATEWVRNLVADVRFQVDSSITWGRGEVTLSTNHVLPTTLGKCQCFTSSNNIKY